MREKKYTFPVNDILKQYCFGIVFDKIDFQNHQFEYSLRFNISHPLD